MYKLHLMALKVAASIYPEERDLKVLFEKTKEIVEYLVNSDPDFNEETGYVPDVLL